MSIGLGSTPVDRMRRRSLQRCRLEGGPWRTFALVRHLSRRHEAPVAECARSSRLADWQGRLLRIDAPQDAATIKLDDWRRAVDLLPNAAEDAVGVHGEGVAPRSSMRRWRYTNGDRCRVEPEVSGQGGFGAARISVRRPSMPGTCQAGARRPLTRRRECWPSSQLVGPREKTSRNI